MSRARAVLTAVSQQPQTKRTHLRAQIVPTEIRGIVTTSSEQDHFPFLVWDVSPTGLGLWMSKPVAPGENIKVVIGQPYLLMLNATVVWCDEDASANGYRCGVQVEGKRPSLESLYEKFK